VLHTHIHEPFLHLEGAAEHPLSSPPLHEAFQASPVLQRKSIVASSMRLLVVARLSRLLTRARGCCSDAGRAAVEGRLVEPEVPSAVDRAPGDGDGAAGEAKQASGQGGSRGANGSIPLGPTNNDTGGSVGGTKSPCTHLAGWRASGGHGGGAVCRQA